MPSRHYIAISPGAEDFTRRISPKADWQKAIFDDLTQGSGKVAYNYIGENLNGPIIGLYGDTFFCKAGLDRNREDSIFIFRVEDADKHLPNQLPTSYEADFELVRNLDYPTTSGDPVGHLFGGYRKQGTREAPPSATIVSRPDQEQDFDVGELLCDRREETDLDSAVIRTLKSLGDDVLPYWRPHLPDKLSAEPLSHLETFRGIWTRFNFTDLVSRSPNLRLRQILAGRTNPNRIKRKEFEELLRLFSAEPINTFITEKHNDELAPKRFLEMMGALPLFVWLRGQVWKGAAHGLAPLTFKKELQKCVRILDKMDESSLRRTLWSRRLVETIESYANSRDDGRLHRLLSDLEDVDDKLQVVSSWVERLEFRSETPDIEDPSASEPAEEPPKPREGDRDRDDLLEALREAIQGRFKALQLDSYDRWAIGLTLKRQESVWEVAQEATDRLTDTLDTVTKANSVDSLLDSIGALQTLRSSIPEWLERMPELEVLEDINQEAETVHAELVDSVGESGARKLIARCAPHPEDLQEALEVFGSHRQLLNALPDWLWADFATAELPKELHWLETLLSPERRKRVISLIRDLRTSPQFSSTDLDRLASIERPEDLSGFDQLADYFIQRWQELREFSSLLTGIDSLHEPWVAELREQGLSAGKIKECIDSLEQWRVDLGDDTLLDIAVTLEEAGDIGEFERIQGALSEIKSQFGGTLPKMSLEQILNFATQNGGDDGLEETSRSSDLLNIRHDWVGIETGRRATLVFHRDEDDNPWTTAPLVLVSARQRSLRLELSFELKGASKRWPPYGMEPSPSHVSIRKAQWQRDFRSDEYLYPIKLKLPFDKMPSKTSRLRLKVTGRNSDTGEVILESNFLSWTKRSDKDFEELSLDWAGVPELDYIDQHPIGAQKRRREILRRLNSSHSIAVTAPRRFGKTTLIQYLEETGREKGFVVPDYIQCTDFQTHGRSGLDYKKLWKRISDNLQEELGASIEIPEEGMLPEMDAFRFVRRAARNRDYKAIVILFDEAHLLFPKFDRGQLGDRFKDRLEREWATETEEKVPVVFGLVGLQLLHERVPNFIGALQSFESESVDEDDLYQVILQRTQKRMETTRAARRLISRSVSGIYILRTLLDKLVALANREKRYWINVDDVLTVKRGLLQNLRDGRESHIAKWVLDAINDADDVNHWAPKREYPAALALADAHQRTATLGHSLVRSVMERLNEWSRTVSGSGFSALSYSEELVEEHIQSLRNAGILENYDFRSEFFQAWLEGQLRRGVEMDPKFCRALRRGATREIRQPDYWEAIDDSGGTRIYKFYDDEDDRDFAYRGVTVNDDEKRAISLNNLQRLRDLLKGETRSEGRPYLYCLEDVGISKRNPKQIVEIYEWIEGRDLGSYLNRLSPVVATDIGYRLAKALQLIHSHEIVHRDIRPENIVLQASIHEPVLIDFGLARHRTDIGNTTVVDDVAAPEVRTNEPNWSSAADVFSLGATLKKVLADDMQGAGGHHLVELLEHCCRDTPQKRPTSKTGELLKRFESVRAKLEIDRIKKRGRESVRAIIEPDRHANWFSELLKRPKVMKMLEGRAIGHYASTVERCRVMAVILSQVIEKHPGNGPQDLKELENQINGNEHQALRFVRDVRNLNSHAYSSDDRRYQRLARYSDERQLALTKKAATCIQKTCNLQSLVALCDWVLEGAE